MGQSKTALVLLVLALVVVVSYGMGFERLKKHHKIRTKHQHKHKAEHAHQHRSKVLASHTHQSGIEFLNSVDFENQYGDYGGDVSEPAAAEPVPTSAVDSGVEMVDSAAEVPGDDYGLGGGETQQTTSDYTPFEVSEPAPAQSGGAAPSAYASESAPAEGGAAPSAYASESAPAEGGAAPSAYGTEGGESAYGAEQSQPAGGQEGGAYGAEQSQPAGGQEGGAYGAEQSQPAGGQEGGAYGAEQSQPAGGQEGGAYGAEQSQPAGGQEGGAYGAEQSQPAGGQEGDAYGAEQSQPAGGQEGGAAPSSSTSTGVDETPAYAVEGGAGQGESQGPPQGAEGVEGAESQGPPEGEETPAYAVERTEGAEGQGPPEGGLDGDGPPEGGLDGDGPPEGGLDGDGPPEGGPDGDGPPGEGDGNGPLEGEGDGNGPPGGEGDGDGNGPPPGEGDGDGNGPPPGEGDGDGDVPDPNAIPATPQSIEGVPENGLQLVKDFEGCKLTAYPDPKTGGAPWTIGWGTTRNPDGSPIRPGQTIDQATADAWLGTQLKNDYLPKLESIPGWDGMNDNQKGALMSFAYNLGPNFYNGRNFNSISTVLREGAATGDYSRMGWAMEKYRNPGSNVEQGLLRRRRAEAALFGSPGGTTPTGSSSSSPSSSSSSTSPSASTSSAPSSSSSSSSYTPSSSSSYTPTSSAPSSSPSSSSSSSSSSNPLSAISGLFGGSNPIGKVLGAIGKGGNPLGALLGKGGPLGGILAKLPPPFNSIIGKLPGLLGGGKPGAGAKPSPAGRPTAGASRPSNRPSTSGASRPSNRPSTSGASRPSNRPSSGSRPAQGNAGTGPASPLEIQVTGQENGVSIVAKPQSGGFQGDWSPDQETRAAADAQQTVGYETDPDATRYTVSTNPHRSIQPGIQLISDYIQNKFRGFATSIGGYSNRANTANRSQLSQHALGKALDIMITPQQGGAADNKVGDILARWLVQNSSILGVQIVIWDKATYKSYRSSHFNTYTGPHPHRDHIHVDFRRANAAKSSLWFKEDPSDHMKLVPL